MIGDPQCRRRRDRAGVPVDQGVPDCGTGPAGRLGFVARELAALWHRYRSAGEE
jgi:hypothetical protein